MKKKPPDKKGKSDEIEELSTFIESKINQNKALQKILQEISKPKKNDTTTK